MKRKASSILLIAAFLLVLFCPHILWRSISKQSGAQNMEKRTLAQMPVFSLQEIDGYPKAVEEYYNDHLPFRDWLIKLYNSLQVHVFRTSSNENVILGKDGWLFYSSRTDGTSMECYDGSMLFTDEELAHIAANLTGAQRRLAEQGTELIVLIAPSKERIYSEYMPDHLGEPAQECMVNQVTAYLREHTDVRVVYPYEEMMAQKKADQDHLLYYRTDAHWNGRGAYIGAKALLAEMGIEIAPLDQLETVAENPFPCDLASMLNVWGMDETGFKAAAVPKTAPQLETVSNEEYGRMEYVMEDAAPISLFMYKDSFGTPMARYLKYYLSHTTFEHTYSYDPSEMLAQQPDVFVLEVTERYIRRLRNPVL